ncbi:hypothetical protein AAHC03_017267 [Spirometra sp. Aus1]
MGRCDIFFVGPRADLLVTSAPKLRPRSYTTKPPNEFHHPGNSDLTLSELAIMLHGPPLYELRPSIPAEPTACPCLPSAFPSASPPMLNPFFPSISSSTSASFPSTSSTTTPSPYSPSFTHSSSDLSACTYIEHKSTNEMVTEADLRGSSFPDVMPLPDLLNSQSSLPSKPISRSPAIRLPSQPKSRPQSPAFNSHVSCSMLDPISNPRSPPPPALTLYSPLLTDSSRVNNISLACHDRRPPFLPRRRRLQRTEGM